MRTAWFTAVALAGAACGQASVPASQASVAPDMAQVEIVNPGFEDGASGVAPSGWRVEGGTGSAALFPEARRSGGQGLAIVPAPDLPAVVFQSIDAAPFLGRRVVLQGFARASSPSAEGTLWIDPDGPGPEPAYDSGAGGAHAAAWRPHRIAAFIPRDAETITFGVRADAALYVDDFSLTDTGDDVPAPLTPSGLQNLTAFAHLYGYVRFFHPSDEAADSDWDQVALAGVAHVEQANGPAELRAALLDVFAPLAPTLAIQPAGAPPPQLDLPDGERIAWRRTGLGEYQSDLYRAERASAPDTLADFATLDMPGGLTAYVPLKAVRADDRTRPVATAAPFPVSKPDGFSPNGGDRASRLAAVIIAWNVFQHFYPYWETVDVDWLAQLQDSLADAAQDTDAAAFDLTLERLVAASLDGHGTVRRLEPAGRLPLQWAWIEDSLVVTAVYDQDGLQIGDIVIAIDGAPVGAVMDDWLVRSAGATEGWKRVKALERLPWGEIGETVVLSIARRPDERADIAMARQLWRPGGPALEPRPDVVAELEPGILYVDLTRLSDAAAGDAMERMAEADALVFDMRGYPAGSAPLQILPRLSDRPIQSPVFHIPTFPEPDQRNVAFIDGGGAMTASPEPFDARRVVFMTDARAVSYGETVMGIVEGMALGEIVGSRTAGTNGNIDRYVLPTGHQLVWTGMQVLKHDGSPHHGVGVLPTIPAASTIEGVRAGQDEVLAAALEAARR